MNDTTSGSERSVRLSVPSMDCPSCAGKVEGALDRVDGVGEVDLRPTAGTARVSYDPGVIDEDAVVAAVESAGYDVVAASDADGDESIDLPEPAAVWTSRRAIGVWIGAVALAAGLAVEFLLPGADVRLLTVEHLVIGVADLGYLLAAVTGGIPVVRGGYYSARNRSLDIDLLMGAAILAATGIGYFVEAATLAVLFSTAELLERYAMDRTRDSLRELVELSPEEATVRRPAAGGETEEVTVPVEAVEVGDVVTVRPGEKVPVDGVVLEGQSALDESPITGEHAPADKSAGDEVYAGSINETGFLAVEAAATADDSTIARIVDLVREAQASTTEREQFVDRFASYYTPAVVAFAILTAAVPPLATGGDPGTWFVRGLTLLVIACPCAFVISTPVSVASGITAAARNGVLVKGGNHLESLGEVDAVAFDKTGTLTKGELTVTDVLPIGDGSRDELLATAAALEERSEHPIAAAVRERATAESADGQSVEDFATIPGMGVRATIGGTTYFAGKPGLLAEQGVDLSHLHAVPDGGERGGRSRPSSNPRPGGGAVPAGVDPADCDRTDCVDLREDVIADLQADGKTVVLVGTEERLLGALGIADELRPKAPETVRRLRDLGVEHVVMLTGDNEGTARAVAEQVGVDQYRAELLPDEKVEAIETLQAEYGAVAMVGDGINDAPSLAAATVGIAMGAAGTDTAIETADVALMGDDLRGLPYCYALAGTANDVIRQNVWSSLGVKLVLAVGAPLGYVTVATAVIVGDMGMSLGVTGNAMRLARLDPADVLE